MTTLFSNEVLDMCTVLQVHDLFPKKIGTSDTPANLRDSFLFLTISDSKPIVHYNLGFEPTESELNNLKKYASLWGIRNSVEIRNGILEIDMPSFLVPFVNRINGILGARICPNMLRARGDVYISIEYAENASYPVSEAVMEFLSQNHLFAKELVYSGKNDETLPYIVRLYGEIGNSLDNLFMITTAWDFSEEQREKENQGLLRNMGVYVPKYFVDGSTDKLLFRAEKPEISVDCAHDTVETETGLFEVEMQSSFFSDFYREIIREYSGPIFMTVEITNERQISHYLIEEEHQGLFIKGLLKHWQKEVRSDHVNYITSAGKLSSFVNKN